MPLNGIQIKQVRTRSDLRDFIELPFLIYRDDPNWAPPLIAPLRRLLKGKTAFGKHGELDLFLARVDGIPVARVAAIRNHAHNEFYNDRTGFFGFFECYPGQDEAVLHLFEAVERLLRRQGYETVRGPVNPSMNATCGLLVYGFDGPPAALMPYNPPRYARLLEATGLRKCKDMYAYLLQRERVHAGSPGYDRLMALSDRILRRHPEISVRAFDRRRLREEILRALPVFENARRDNWGYVPVTHDEVMEMVRDLKLVLDPDIVTVAEIDGEPVGVCLAIPDINEILRHLNGRLFPLGIFRFLRQRRRIRRIRVFGIAALPRVRNLGVAAVVLAETIRRAEAKGYQEAEASWVLEDNVRSSRLIEQILNPIRYRTYRLYEKTL